MLKKKKRKKRLAGNFHFMSVDLRFLAHSFAVRFLKHSPSLRASISVSKVKGSVLKLSRNQNLLFQDYLMTWWTLILQDMGRMI